MTKIRNLHSERIKWIDVGKGIGLLLVIFGHLATAGSTIAVWIFSFHIPLFFFLSGYVSKFRSDNSKLFLKKILVSLIVPYFIFVLIGLMVSLIIPAWRPVSLGQVLFDVFYMVEPNSLHVGQLWFLFCLAIVQILFLIFLKFNFKNKFIVSGIILLFAVISFLIYKYNIGILINGNHLRIPWKIDSAFMGLFFFCLGYYSKILRLISKFCSKNMLSSFIIMVLLFITNVYVSTQLNRGVNLGANIYNNLIYYIIASLSGIIFILYISKFIENNRLLSYMGRNTLSIFSSHSILLYFYAFLLSNILGRSIMIMINIPLYLSVVGLVSISIVSLIIPVIYNNTVQKLIIKLK